MFKAWPKIPRLENEVYHITEKLDGTNACIIIDYSGNLHTSCLYRDNINATDVGIRAIYAQSRTRLITPEDDNYGFAKWVQTNAEQLIEDLGMGYHFGEWWGQGIQRNYGLTEKRFSLFNPAKTSSICHNCIPFCSISAENLQDELNFWKTHLFTNGSLTVPGYMKPEGLVVYAEKAKQYWKVITD